jgi:NAD-dependent dihydropyrimidine dehydrogenase PreA subunit
VSDETRRAISDDLHASGIPFIAISDLCGMTVNKGRELKEIVDRAGNIVVIGCFPRTVKWLFCRIGINWNAEKIKVINIRNESIEKVVEKVRELDLSGQDMCDKIVSESDKSQWDPWFPVVDYDRCENCKQCMSFCLFGVYETDGNNKIEVKNPKNCKNNCPACARICPKAAIIFPKYTESPINGDEIGDEESIREKIKVNVDEILGNDVYAALEERRKKAKKLLIKKNNMEQAELERKKFSG